MTKQWILCSDEMPKEHDSIFAKLKNTDKWHKRMFEKVSEDVNVTIEFDDGKRKNNNNAYYRWKMEHETYI